MRNLKPGGGMPANVNAQAVVQILSTRISALTLENAMLQARLIELEGQIRTEAVKREAGAKGGNEK